MRSRPVLMLALLVLPLVQMLPAGCASRGNDVAGWVIYDDHTRYQAESLSDSACRLTVAFERTASFTGDAQSEATLAMAAFQKVALSLQKPDFDPHDVQIVRRMSPSGVQIITMQGVVTP
jgi:hypothetical protein